MDQGRMNRATLILLSVLAVWGLAVAGAAQSGLYGAIPPLLLAPMIALGIVAPVIVYARYVVQPGNMATLGHLTMTRPDLWAQHVQTFMRWLGDGAPSAAR